MRRRQRDERGAVIVEAAFILPVLFLLMLTFFDFSAWLLDSDQAATAARDGARIGSLYYYQADQSGTTEYSKVIAAAAAHVTDAVNSSNVTVACVSPDAGASIPCSEAIPHCDLIKVTVSWSRTAWSPLGAVFGVETVTSHSQAVILGAPGEGSSASSFDEAGGC